MSRELSSRFRDELELLNAMYPAEISFDEKTAELTFRSTTDSFVLRIDDRYPEGSFPTVLSAHGDKGRVDLREQLRHSMSDLSMGEELLDLIITRFNDIVESTDEQQTPDGSHDPSTDTAGASATVVIWLHHLLNTGKRKSVLNPVVANVNGVSKPGYPGVLVFSGCAQAVHAHVSELKQLNWQAFQVRLQDDEEWSFEHGQGLIEVETMGDLVQQIVGDRKQMFLEAMHIK